MIRKNLRSLILILSAAIFMAGAVAASVASEDLANQVTEANPYSILHGRDEMNYYDLAAVLSFVFGSSALVAAFLLFRK